MVAGAVAVIGNARFVAARATVHVPSGVLVAVALVSISLVAATVAVVPAETGINGLSLRSACAGVWTLLVVVVVVVLPAERAAIHLQGLVVSALADIRTAIVAVAGARVRREVVVVVRAIARIAPALVAAPTDIRRPTDVLVSAVAYIPRRSGVVARGAGADVHLSLVARALGPAVIIRLRERRSGQATEDREVHKPQPGGATSPAQEVATAGIYCRLLDSLRLGRMVEQDATH